MQGLLPDLSGMYAWLVKYKELPIKFSHKMTTLFKRLHVCGTALPTCLDIFFLPKDNYNHILN